MRSVFIKALAGLIGGGLAWLLTAPSAPTSVNNLHKFQRWESLFLIMVIACIAISLGIASGLQKGSWLHVAKEGGLGLIFGTIGGMMGASIGTVFATMIFPTHIEGMGPMPVQIAWRILALSPIGFGLGLGIGAAGWNLSRTLQGAIGGLLGGVVAAGSFDIIGKALSGIILAARGTTTGEVGGPSRAVFAILMGLGIGLFIGIAERVMATAFVRLHLGRNEGREWVVDKPHFVLGRAELADAPITGDPAIMPQHAVISKENGQYFVTDNNTPNGTYLDGVRIGKAPLQNGSWIGIGAAKIQFLLKKSAPVPLAAYAGPQPGQQAYDQAQFARTQQAPGFGGQHPGLNPNMPGMGMPMPSNPMPPNSMGPNTMAQNPTMGMMPPNPGFNSPATMPTQMAGGFASFNQFKLVAITGPLAGQVFTINKLTEIGRDASDIKMPTDGQASRRHASLTPQQGGISVVDLGSTNGTFVNDQRLQNGMASVGDMLRIGSTTFRIDPA